MNAPLQPNDLAKKYAAFEEEMANCIQSPNGREVAKTAFLLGMGAVVFQLGEGAASKDCGNWLVKTQGENIAEFLNGGAK